MSSRNPPRFVPTLTEVVRESTTVPTAPLAQEDLVRRVMQRVDLMLERRLREAIATVVLEHTRDIGPALRERIEDLVRDAVSQAVSQESGASGSATKGT
ncbi:hypothetical protein [Ramlibacter sp.]|uniref:hypothetical protein n=1 Tax=Ramlibacter sp. TaxID=1917967 RepID=UPI001840286E|nr:hypothetical protein [Ramlibacter sp.]MBA2673521.1 hypothetical protein [Ramlibacter sp.]